MCACVCARARTRALRSMCSVYLEGGEKKKDTKGERGSKNGVKERRRERERENTRGSQTGVSRRGYGTTPEAADWTDRWSASSNKIQSLGPKECESPSFFPPLPLGASHPPAPFAVHRSPSHSIPSSPWSHRPFPAIARKLSLFRYLQGGQGEGRWGCAQRRLMGV